MLNPRAAQISKKLRDVFIGEGLARLQLHNQFTTDKQIGKIIAKNSPVLVQDLQGMLLFNLDIRLAQPIGQSIFINFFQMAMP